MRMWGGHLFERPGCKCVFCDHNYADWRLGKTDCSRSFAELGEYIRTGKAKYAGGNNASEDNLDRP